MYQPIMSEENVRRLYFLKLEKKKPMTKLLDQILNEYFEQQNSKSFAFENDEAKEGGEEICMNVKSAETHSKSNQPKKERIVMTPGTDTAHSVEPSTTP
jgi:hypothetical protein